MAIACNEIETTINQLLISFQDCKKINLDDLHTLVELVAAVSLCASGGVEYNVVHTDVYSPDVDTVVTYESGEYHSISVSVNEGSITLQAGVLTATWPQGSTLNHEVSTLNELDFTFTVKAGATVTVQYINATE